MVPHAGLIYSGRIAAKTLQRVVIPNSAIVIGAEAHAARRRLGPRPAPALGRFPGATIESDEELGRALLEAIPGLEADAAAHAQEHAIEVELPFIARLAPQTKVMGVAIGAGDLARCREFAAGLAKVIRAWPSRRSSSFQVILNHFASDAENRRLDQIALAAWSRSTSNGFMTRCDRSIISMCGLLPAIIVMETLRELGQLKRCQRVDYATSADVSGDTSRVVGYAGVLLGPESSCHAHRHGRFCASSRMRATLPSE
jgi:AmmeMemoRadiSam system protein B